MIVGVHKVRSTMFMPLVGWAIMIFQGMNPFKKSSWNHLACSYLDEAGHFRFFDSTGKYGFEERSFHTFHKTNHIVETYYVRIPGKREQLIDWIFDNDPIDYDKGQIKGNILQLLGLVSFNKFGKNFKRLTCNEVFLKLLKDFRGIYQGDPDNYDLLTTWDMVLKYGKRARLQIDSR